MIQETSLEAFAPSTRGAQRLRVLDAYKSREATGATDFEIAEQLGILRTTAGARRLELGELVVKTTERRKTDTGCSAIVWRAA